MDGLLCFADCFQLRVELKIRLFASVSWCFRFEHRFVASLENTLSVHRQWPTQTVSDCGLGHHSGPSFDSLGHLDLSYLLRKNFPHAREIKFIGFGFATADPSSRLLSLAYCFLEDC